MSSVSGSPSPIKFTSAEKRAVHNALERKRRDHIKDMFSQLKDSVPNLAGEKVSMKASRAQILKKACDYIQMMRKKNLVAAKDLDQMNQQIIRTKKQINKLESIRNTNRYISGLGPPPPPPLPSSTNIIQIPHHDNTTTTLIQSPIYIPSTLQRSNLDHHHHFPHHHHHHHLNNNLVVTAAPPGTYPLTLDNFHFMTTRLPQLNTLQRLYVADIPLQQQQQQQMQNRNIINMVGMEQQQQRVSTPSTMSPSPSPQLSERS